MFLTQKLEEEPPIFKKHKADFDTSYNVTHLVAGSDHLVIALANKVLRKVDASRKEKQEAERPGGDAAIPGLVFVFCLCVS